jgi:hypothetical protein
MASASNPHSRKHLFRATPLPVTPPPVKPRAVALPPADIPSPDKTIAAQLKIDALKRKAKFASYCCVGCILAVILIISYECSERWKFELNPNRSWFTKIEESIPSSPFSFSLSDSKIHWEFSLKKFLASGSGWIVVFLTAQCVINLIACFKYENAANTLSKKNPETIC